MYYPATQMSGLPSLSQIFGGVDCLRSSPGFPRPRRRRLGSGFIPIAGSKPNVTIHGDYSEITFTPDQEERVSAWILTQLNHEPGPVRVDASGVAMKVISRKYWPYARAPGGRCGGRLPGERAVT